MTDTHADITIRAAEPDDVAEYARIHNIPEVMRETSLPPYMAIIEHPQRVTNSPTNRHLVAERGGAVAGFASLLLYRGRRAHAASIAIAVDPAHQGHGVGIALMEALIQLGEQWYGIKRFELKVLTANQRAVRLYERFGFEIEATHRQFSQREGQYVDAYSMARLAK